MSDFSSVWDYELLWSKCKFYAQKSLNEPREGSMFAFWSAIVIEFLGRATLAKVHPVLLADPRDGDNILYVFGYSKNEGPPKSIVSKTVFDRCTKVVPNFTKVELETCLLIVDKRNEELHSGAAAFIDFPIKNWLSKYYNACNVLLDFTGKTLSDLYGEEEAKAALEMIAEVDKLIIVEVKNRIKDSKKLIEGLDAIDRELTIKNGSIKAKETIFFNVNGKLEKCIACGSDSIISGKTVKLSQDKLQDGEIVYEKIILPTMFTCFSCGLKLNNHQELVIADYGGQFTETVIQDPIEYHDIKLSEFDPSDYYDYGND